MSDRVLDASALLASIFREPGHEIVEAAISDSVISAVNWAEVASKLSDEGYADDQVQLTLDKFGIEVVPFSATTATESGLLRSATRSAGLSLGDRACLALAIELGLPAVTADRQWTRVRTKAKVELIR